MNGQQKPKAAVAPKKPVQEVKEEEEEEEDSEEIGSDREELEGEEEVEVEEKKGQKSKEKEAAEPVFGNIVQAQIGKVGNLDVDRSDMSSGDDKFASLDLTQATQDAIKDMGFTTMTEIQMQAFPFLLLLYPSFLNHETSTQS